MDDRQPPAPLGRGGRGAMLMAALQSQTRCPGGVPSAASVPTRIATGADSTSAPAAVGRAALLQHLLQGSGNTTPEISPQKHVENKSSAVGRGFPQADFGSGQLPQSSPSPSHVTRASPEPPIQEMESLTIGQHSGSSGDKVQMEVNYVRLKSIEGLGIYEYHVDFAPVIDSRNMRFKVMAQPEVKEIIGNIKSFDGAKMYLPVQLNNGASVTTALPTDGSKVTVIIKYIRMSCGNDMIHLYNVLLHKIMSTLKMTQIGRNHFNPDGGIEVPQHRLEIWPGYVTAVQEYEGGVMLNCDASFKVLRTVTARDVMTQCASNAQRLEVEIQRQLIGCVVMTKYNNKTYRIDDIDFQLNPKSSFTTRDSRQITYIDYYKNMYDIVIKDADQPLLINRPKKRNPEEPDRLVCLVPELCYLTGLTDAMRADFKVMKDIAVHTRVNPNRRQYCLMQFIDSINASPDAKKILANWNLQFDTAAVSLDGRKLNYEQIHFGNQSIVANPKCDWTFDLCKNRVIVPVKLENWVVICVGKNASVANDFIKMMQQVSPNMGIGVRSPVLRTIPDDRTETFCSELRKSINNNVQVVVIIFPTPRDDRYSAVKKMCCIDNPIPSQVINVRTISRADKLRSVVQKIALQINCKLGGELWSVPIPMDNAMVCGMDAYHDSINKKNSILGFVASTNRNFTRWFSQTCTQHLGQEIGNSLRILFTNALRKYHEINHKFPQKVIMFRDGVGDGMLDMVAKYEVEQLASCFKSMQVGYNPSLSVVVVQKRINTRMYVHGREGLQNPKPGSVLDHTVTRKRLYDFFLVSQHVGQGTVSPTHYVVAYDNSTLKADHMQKLAYKMTHLYYNWPGTIRVPAPCQYAHKIAYLVGQNLHKDANPHLADKLFYL